MLDLLKVFLLTVVVYVVLAVFLVGIGVLQNHYNSVTPSNTQAKSPATTVYFHNGLARSYEQKMHKCAAMTLAQHKAGMPKGELNAYYQGCLIFFEATI